MPKDNDSHSLNKQITLKLRVWQFLCLTYGFGCIGVGFGITAAAAFQTVLLPPNFTATSAIIFAVVWIVGFFLLTLSSLGLTKPHDLTRKEESA